MKLTKHQFNFLIAVICGMILALMVMACGYAYEFGLDPISEDTDTEAKETEITVETLPRSEVVTESTESVETITAIEEESTETGDTVPGVPASSVTVTEAAPMVYEEEFPWYTSDYELLARLLWAEARGESFEGQLAVVEVVFNRVLSDNFPNTIYDVIYEPGQFTSASSLEYVTPTQTQYDVVTAALRGERVLNNEKCVFFSVGSSCGSYYTTIGNHVFGTEY